jgi:hypothetical protein
MTAAAASNPESSSGWAASETTSGWVAGTWAATAPKDPWAPDPTLPYEPPSSSAEPATPDAPATPGVPVMPIDRRDAEPVSATWPGGLGPAQAEPVPLVPAPFEPAQFEPAQFEPAQRVHPATLAAAAAIAAAGQNSAARTPPQHPGVQHPAAQDPGRQDVGSPYPGVPEADRTGQHFPRRSRGSVVRRTGNRPDSPPPAEQGSAARIAAPAASNRQRINHPRGETRRRISTASTEVFPAVSDATHVLPAVPVVEGYGTFDTGQRDGRADGARPRESDGPARPRPRPRPRPGAQPGDDRQPARSTVYVSRHAAEPT